MSENNTIPIYEPIYEKYCAYCAEPFENADQQWPKKCKSCEIITYRNPIPVACTLLPVKNNDKIGLLTVQRGIFPARGLFALPGGYLELNETWQEGSARELWEETNYKVKDVNNYEIFMLDTNRLKDRILIFGLLPPVDLSEIDLTFTNPEVLSMKIIYEYEDLAFPPHSLCIKKYFDQLT